MTSPGGNRKELDSMVVEIELTLCSIIQGVALYFLVDNARLVLSGGQFAAWPYVATGLLILLLFWSRSLIHTLTLIRWPLEFVHNFFYIACALVEALAFTRLADPFGCQVIGSAKEIPGYAKAPLEPDVSGNIRPPFLAPARQGTVFWVGYTYTQMGGVIRRYHVAFRDDVLANPTTSVILGEDIGEAQYPE